jgi:hypothetical protein
MIRLTGAKTPGRGSPEFTYTISASQIQQNPLGAPKLANDRVAAAMGYGGP